MPRTEREFTDPVCRARPPVSAEGQVPGDRHALGDWFTPDTTFPRAVAGTYGYWRVVDALAHVAAVLGDDTGAAAYRAEALALDMGTYPAGEKQRLFDHFTASVRNAGDHLLLGEISLSAALRVLSAGGRDDILNAVATRTTSPGHGYQVLAGNTTLGESWDGGPGQSQNHFMLGAIGSWFTTRVAGLDQTPDSVGFAKLLIAPAVEGATTSASASHRTPYGVARTAWRRTADRFRLTADVPAGSTAEVRVPLLGGRAAPPSGAHLVCADATTAVHTMGSGHWTFGSDHLPRG
ncbi:alpha-L-rhamnosidase C-terminal domain-containing protein [Streptomyces sp. NPDC090306]|uniref:alpha-L-rhamnosidase-related protein n=1 Tax=Streptomyces sp. NPDC090306 TaxID=3365961 RepID=UPI00381C900F